MTLKFMFLKIYTMSENCLCIAMLSYHCTSPPSRLRQGFQCRPSNDLQNVNIQSRPYLFANKWSFWLFGNMWKPSYETFIRKCQDTKNHCGREKHQNKKHLQFGYTLFQPHKRRRDSPVNVNNDEKRKII